MEYQYRIGIVPKPTAEAEGGSRRIVCILGRHLSRFQDGNRPTRGIEVSRNLQFARRSIGRGSLGKHRRDPRPDTTGGLSAGDILRIPIPLQRMSWHYPNQSLCLTCSKVKRITNKRGSTFYMCTRHKEDPSYAKYPPQPRMECPGYDDETAQHGRWLY